MFQGNQVAIYTDKSNSRVSWKVKEKIYTLVHALSQALGYSALLYKLLLLLECLQFLWWALDPRASSLWNVEVFTYLLQFLKYIQLDGTLQQDNSSIFILTIFIVFGIQIAALVLVIINIYLISKISVHKTNSTLFNYCAKTLSTYSILLNTVLPLPFYSVLISGFICFDSDSRHGSLMCYSGVYWVYLALAVIGAIILTFTSVSNTLLSIDLNPWSKIPFSAPQSRLNLIKLLLKIIIPIYASADYKKQYVREFLIIYCLVWLFILILRYRQTPYYNRSVFSWSLRMEMIIFWTTLVALFHMFFDNYPPDNTGMLFWVLIAPFMAYTYVVIVRRRTKIYRKLKMKSFTKDVEVEMYIINIINLIEGRDKQHKRMSLEGLLKYHVKNCSKNTNECCCLNLLKNQENTDEASEKEWYSWIKSITLEALEKFPKSIRLHLLYAYIQKEKLDNKFKALFELMIAVDSKPSFEEEYAIFRYKNIIEEEIIENDQKHIESKGIDVNLIVDFENKFVNFQTAIEIAVEAHLDFWRELLENNPEIQKLQTLGSHITKSLEEADRQYKGLCAINPNHLRMLKIYGNFLKDVVNDESESQRIMEKAEQIDKSSVVNRQFVDEDKLKYGDNSNPCIVTCSGNFSTMGIVLNANNEVFKLLGYSKVELIGQNINSVMPKVLGDEHDYIMKNYFETGKDKAIGLERIVFPVTKKGYILPCSLMVKVLPNISEGLKIVGFLKELEEETRDGEEMDKEKTHYILYDGHTEAIHGVTYSCKKQFGISGGIVKSSNMGNNDFTIDVIFPDLLQCSVEELKAGDIATTLNTMTLKENYMVDNEESEEEEEYDEPEQRENARNSRYRMTQVGATLIQDEEYNELNLRVLRFVELMDDNNNFSNSQAQAIADTTLNKSNLKSENQNPDAEVEDDVDKSLNGGNSDVESQAGNEMNEDIRLLKDFKALISEKTVPKSIKVLRNAVIFFSILFIVLISVDLSMNINEANEFKEGVTSISAAYHRTYVVADITLRIRKLQLLATGFYKPSDSGSTERTLRSELNSLLDSLRALTLEIGDNQDSITDIGFDAIENTIVRVQSLIQTGTKLTSVSFSDAVSQFTSYATAVASTALANFNTTDPTDSTKASFYFVRRNGLFPLRLQSEANAQSFHDFYIERTYTYDGRTRIIMILALVVLAISEIILVPIVFSVHKTATKVLSLFGYITTSEISELADKCEVYMDTYLEHRHEQQAYLDEEEEEDVRNHTIHNDDGQKPSKTSRYGDKEYLEVFQNAGDEHNGSKNNSQLDVSRASHKDIEKGDNGLNDSKHIDGLSPSPSIFLKPTPSIPSGAKSFGRERSLGNSKVGREEDKKGQELEEEAEQGNLRSQKLLNSKDNIRGKVVFQFTFIVALIAAYFVADYTTERQQQENIRKGLDHMILLSQVNPDYVYMISFTLEQLAMVYPAVAFSFPNLSFEDWRSVYKSRSLSIFTELSNSAMDSYPSSFSNYLNNLNSYSSNDICTAFYASGSSASNNCSNVADGLLERGIALGSTRITQISDDLIRVFNTTSMSTSDQISFISGSDYQQMEDLLDLITPVIQGLQNSLNSSFESYLNYSSMIERVKFGIFIAALFLLFVVLWTPYLKSLKEKIFRTKGMLNMIPMTIITKNENLKAVFIQGDILQAVK